MKLKFSITAVLSLTCCLLGLIYFAIEKVNPVISPKDIKKNPQPADNLELFDQTGPKDKIIPAPVTKEQDNKEDELIIRELASLSDEALREEFVTISQHIKNKNLYVALQKGKLSTKDANEAKELLERSTLLSLEGTRRKYMGIEPELRDALFAHRDSLKDIRQLLNRF